MREFGVGEPGLQRLIGGLGFLKAAPGRGVRGAFGLERVFGGREPLLEAARIVVGAVQHDDRNGAVGDEAVPLTGLFRALLVRRAADLKT